MTKKGKILLYALALFLTPIFSLLCRGHCDVNKVVIRALKNTEENAQLIQDLSTDAFTVNAVLQGQHGGKLLLVERKLGWGDLRCNLMDGGDGDLTIDLRILPTVLGEKGAEFFGYKILSKTLALIPDPEEVSGAIDAFNASLPEGSLMRIITKPKSVAKEIIVSAEKFVREYVDNHTVPNSQVGRQFWHDISGHAMQGFFDDNKIVTLLRKRASIWNNYRLDRSKTPGFSLPAAMLEDADKKVFEVLGSQIDGLGNGVSGTLNDSIVNAWSAEARALALGPRSDAELGMLGATRKWLSNAQASVTTTYEVQRLSAASTPPDIFFKDLLPSEVNADFQS